MEFVNKVYGNSNLRNCRENKSSDESIKNVSSNSLFKIKKLMIKIANRVIIANLNTNSLPSKFDQLKKLVLECVDILVITQSKLDDTFPTSQFLVDGFSEHLTETEMVVV